jgi:poly(hydroxyalkanoate) depolymerase family esterase
VYAGVEGTLPWRVARPSGAAPDHGWPTLVFLHGCTQDAADAAAGTRLDREATARGWLVIYPEQTPERHPFRCWNWYEPEDFGEVALLLALVDEVAGTEGGNPNHRAVAGMSAGGAMAMRLATEAPRSLRAVFSHSGVDPALVSNQLDALQRMQGVAPSPATPWTGREGFDPASLPPLLLIHGDEDAVVSPLNLGWASDGWRSRLALAGGDAAGGDAAGGDAAAEDPSEEQLTLAGRSVLRRVWGERLVSLAIGGLGHAWSGGDPSGSYTDPEGPAATTILLDFIERVVAP